MELIETIEYDYNTFTVNSVTFIGETPFFILSVDNFGLIVFNALNGNEEQLISFDDLQFDVPLKKFEIYKLIPIDVHGVRVLLKGDGGFSLYWEEINLEGDLLTGLIVKDRFENINTEIPSKLAMPTKSGYVQLILYPNNENSVDVYIRVFNFFNHLKSKSFKEYKVSQVDNCESFDIVTHFSDQEIGVILSCGYQLYVYYIDLMPFLQLTNLVNNNEIQATVSAKNDYSEQTINVKLIKKDTNSDFGKGYLFMIFILVVLIFFVSSLVFCQKLMKMKLKETPKAEVVARLSQSFKSNTMDDRQTERVSMKKRFTEEEHLRKYKSHLEMLEEDFDEEGTQEQEDSLNTSIRNTLNYRINNTDTFVSRSSAARGSEAKSSFRYSYNRSSTTSFHEKLNKKMTMGFKL